MPIACIENPVDGDPFRKVATGQPLRVPAIAYNAMIDAALDFKNRRDNGRGQTINRFPEAGIILVKNGGETNLDRFEIMELSAPILDADDNINEFQASVKMSGGVPASAAPWNSVAILLQPIAAGSIGKAVISGVVVCQVNMVRSTDTYADITPGESGYLTSSTCGPAEILWADTSDDSGDEGTGGDYEGGDDSDASDPVWAVVRIGRTEAQSQVVFVDDGTDATMQVANSDGLYQGTIGPTSAYFTFGAAGTDDDSPTCWICVNGSGQSPQPPLWQNAAPFNGVYAGLVTSGGEDNPRPLYNVQIQGTYALLAVAQSAASGGSVSVEIGTGSGDTYGDAFTLTADFGPTSGTAGTWASLNIAENDTFKVVYDFGSPGVGDGGYSIDDPTVFDAPVGTMRFVALDQSAPRGWAAMDGSANSSGNGGSGIDMMSFFPYGGTSPSNTAGGVTAGDFGELAGPPEGSYDATGIYGYKASGGGVVASGLPPYKTVTPIERLNTPS
jgi:hypothetical protein